MKKRIISLALALIMLCGMMPIGAFADEPAPAEPVSSDAPASPVEPTPVIEPEATPTPAPEPTATPDADSTPTPTPTATPQPEETPAPTPDAEPTVTPLPDVTPTPNTEDEQDEDTALLTGISTYALGAFDEALLNGIPATADTNRNTGWKVDGTALVSGNSGKTYSTSTLTLTFTADAHISFQYKVSSGTYDTFSVKHNTTDVVSKVYGEIDWSTVTVDVKTGDTLKFTYAKDYSSYNDKGDDRAYITGFSAGEPVVVTFYANNGTEDSTTQNFYSAAALNANPFTKDHAVFDGWATSADGEKVYDDRQTIDKPTEAFALYARWADANVVSFYNGMGGLLSSVNVRKGSAIPADAIPTASCTGYIFSGWVCNSTAFDTATPIESDITLTASWTPIEYTVRFSANNGVGSMSDMSALKYGQSYNLPKCIFENEGYTFAGWATSSYASTVAYADEASFSNLSSTNNAIVTLYAVWRGMKVPVTIDLNYDTENRTSTRTCVVGKNYNHIYNETSGEAQYSSLATPKRDGHSFLGWYTAAEGGEKITTSYYFASTAPVSMYAHWAKSVTVTFDANGGSCSTKSKVINEGSSCGYLPSASLSGKVFDGWYTEKDGGEKITTSTTFNADTTLYAHYRNKQYTIIFKPNGGEGEMTSVRTDCGVDYTLPVCTFTRGGHSFKGWATYSTASDISYTDGGVINRDTYDGASYYLYALWEANPTTGEDTEAEKTLKAALDSLTGYFVPLYGTDTNACRALEALLASNGYSGISVAVKTPAANDYASIAADGAISYHFDDKMYGDDSFLRPVFSFTLSGVTLDKELQTKLTWDLAKVQTRINALAASITVPTQLSPTDTLTLPKYPLKAGIEIADVDYDDATQFDSWATVTWTLSDSDSEIIKIGEAGGSGGFYAPHTVTVIQPKDDADVTLYAGITWNKDNSISANKTFPIKVKGSSLDAKELMRQQLEAKLDSVLTSTGLKDIVTGEALDTGNVVNDIRLPSTRDFGIDGKTQPVTITTSNQTVIPAPDVNNAARVEVYRPAVGESAVDVTLTISITDTETGAVASREITVTVQPLTDAELDAEIALMERVKAAYFDGIKGQNTAPDEITTDLKPFSEAYLGANGNIVWAYKYADQTGHGIVPVALDGWYAAEQWRLFKSSNAQVISHENLLVTRDKEHKTVTVESRLSSETYGKYAVRYPDNSKLQKLYNQPVSAKLTVLGTDPTSEVEDKKLSVLFTLSDNSSPWITCAYTDLAEGVTVYDVFYRALSEKGFGAVGGSFVTGIVKPDGTVLSQKDRGEYSGWMYAVNGSIPNVVMAQYFLSDGDSIHFFYTDDYTALYGQKKSEYTVEDVIKLIDSIGEVTLASGDAITAARRAYETLTQSEKAQVTNRNVLEEAEKAYAALIKRNSEILDIYKITGDYIQRDDDKGLCKFGSEWLVLGLARSGRDVPAEYLEALEEYVRGRADNNGRLSATKPTENARVILALSALGVDADDFADTNLIAPLADMDYISLQPLSGAVYALLALDSRDYTIPAAQNGAQQTTRESLIEYLLDRQLDNGGWTFSGDSAEVDATAMVLQALSAYYDTASKDALIKRVNNAVDTAVALLADMQTGTGGYESYGTLNSESCAQVITALSTLGIDPNTDKRFIKNGASVVDALCSFYIDGGGFSHTLLSARDALATAQGYYALTAYYRLINGDTSLFDMSDTISLADAA